MWTAFAVPSCLLRPSLWLKLEWWSYGGMFVTQLALGASFGGPKALDTLSGSSDSTARFALTLGMYLVGTIIPWVVAALICNYLCWSLVRRYHDRLRKGICTSCGYDLRGCVPYDIAIQVYFVRCPECGHEQESSCGFVRPCC